MLIMYILYLRSATVSATFLQGIIDYRTMYLVRLTDAVIYNNQGTDDTGTDNK